MTTSSNTYTVYVDDNYDYMDLERRYKLGDFATLDLAIAACQRIVDQFLADEVDHATTPAEQYAQYTGFGPDPFIVTDDPAVAAVEQPPFSAWDYAREKCHAE
jgi:hypothetical protein